MAITYSADAYMLEGDLSLDSTRFVQGLVAAREAFALRAFDLALHHLDTGRPLWRGPAMGSLLDHRLIQREASRLDELHLQAEMLRAEALLALGRPEEAVADLTGRSVAHDSIAEGLWELNILALYRCSRPVEALRTYHQFRADLVEHVGLEPGVALQQLETMILQGGPVLLEPGYLGPGHEDRQRRVADLTTGDQTTKRQRLADLQQEATQLDEAARVALAAGSTWEEIAVATGATAAEARRRWGQQNHRAHDQALVGHQAVMEALVELADEELQWKRWLAPSGPEVSSLVEALCQLFDDSGLSLVLDAGRPGVGPRDRRRLDALGRVLQKLDAGRPPAELLEDPAMVQVRQQAAELVRALAARELRERVDRFVDGTDRSSAAAAAIEGLVIVHFAEESWFDEVSLALATFVPGGGQHYLDEDALADALSGVGLEDGSA